ncbi:hypothetical protein [Methylobacterium brachythecii]|jgi:hypothetical protein|uniref:ABC transporter n=1 Tax=Methylobacterium brachythecii TaxID=1176177 RepID=A0A7W6ADT8_9HYPH|nr:hypothetical protein [Methylobacterium brachythecii]MBB3901450.1 hypothetical protein [Methylobacterium brachythecii]GLS43022.1 hypothetical protein GCM10007884_10070 [Methylobacterium brachythecii]
MITSTTKRVVLLAFAAVVALNASACIGKGKAPPPAPAPVISKY